QAEDGIRDFHVTGVQTCALPILATPVESSAPVDGATAPALPGRTSRGRLVLRRFLRNWTAMLGLAAIVLLFALAYLGPLVNRWRSEERRVGRWGECRGSAGDWNG